MADKSLKCVVCCESFATRDALTHHYANHKPRIRFHVCDICHQGFFTRSSLEQHAKQHTSVPEAFNCDFCGKSFHHKGVLKRHRSLHNKEINLGFEINEKGFRENISLKLHRLTDINKKPFSCDVCTKNFTNETAFLRHHNSHKLYRYTRKYMGKVYVCDICLKEFDAKSKLEEHVQQHSSVKCSECPNIYDDKVTYLKCHTDHKLKNDDQSIPDMLTQNSQSVPKVCMKNCTVQEPHSPKTHIQKVQAKNLRTVSEVQSKTSWADPEKFSTSQDNSWTSPVNSRISSEGVRGVHVCSVCHKVFSTLSKLRRHATRHDPSKPFGCDVCGKFFDDARFVKTHRTLHEKKSRKECDICGKVFNERIFFDIHRLTHFEQKPFRCDICEDIFKDKTSFLRHRNNHKVRTKKVTQRFLSMREVLKQKLEESKQLS